MCTFCPLAPLTSPPAQTRAQRCFPIVEDWCPVLVSAQESRCPNKSATLFPHSGTLGPRGATVPPGTRWCRPPLTADKQFVLAPLQHSVESRPSTFRRQPRWWTNEYFRALVARNSAWRAYRRFGSLRSLSLLSQTSRVLHIVHSGDNGSRTSSRSTTGTPELVRVRSDVVSGFHHGLRPPLWLGRQAWTFFNLMSSHFVDPDISPQLWPL